MDITLDVICLGLKIIDRIYLMLFSWLVTSNHATQFST
jgi:hypothetical protein